MGLRDINWGCLKCKDFKKRDGCYECNIQKSFPKDILKLVTTLIANTKGEGKGGDEFWEKAEKLLY